jgi:hypothetical protein
MPVFLNLAIKSLRGLSGYWCCAFRLQALSAAMALEYSDKKGDVYNILWALVFAFATLNILSLVARRFEPERTGLSFGETVAIMVVVVSVFLLGWEMLYLFHILPIKLQPHEQ